MIRQRSDVPAADDSISSVTVVLQEALSNADAVLAEARTDQRSIAQALKMTTAEAAAGSDDDFIERLRWFVYPKECAVWLSEGQAVAPETESESVLGALRPMQDGPSETPAPTLPLQDDVEIGTGEAGARENRKRKLSHTNSDASNGNADPQSEVGHEPTHQTVEMQEFSSLLAFRDGEHVGEAPLDEIIAGYDDGELSDLCEIYDRESDAWASIESYLRDMKKPESTPPIEQKAEVSKLSSLVESKTEVSHESKVSHVVTDDVNQRKKPQRDSSTWGSTKPAPLIAVPVAETTSTTTASADSSTSAPLTSSCNPSNPMSSKKKRGRGVKPPPKLMRYITQAMIQWDMVKEGDRLLLGLSGGKDSLSLLHCLLEFQRKLPINFEIEVCTIDPMTPSFDPSPLIPYVESLGLKYHYIRDDIVSRASTSGKDGKVVSSLCAFCARMKRGNLYTCARRNNCNKLVLAQHLDDCAESFLMSVMHNGFLRTMKAHYEINAGDLSVIRPMVYCRESLMTDFAKAANLPVINENCPACFEEPKERARIKKLLAREETLYPNLHDNIRRSLIPLMHDDSTAIMRCYLEEAVNKSRKNPVPKNMRKGKRGAEGTSEEKKGEDGGPEANSSQGDATSHDKKRIKTLLSEASDEDLVMELARRKAEKYRLAGSMKRLGDDSDPTGQVCTLNGGDGSIPCRELME